jgi:hypothetical protein
MHRRLKTDSREGRRRQAEDRTADHHTPQDHHCHRLQGGGERRQPLHPDRVVPCAGRPRRGVAGDQWRYSLEMQSLDPDVHRVPRLDVADLRRSVRAHPGGTAGAGPDLAWAHAGHRSVDRHCCQQRMPSTARPYMTPAGEGPDARAARSRERRGPGQLVPLRVVASGCRPLRAAALKRAGMAQSLGRLHPDRGRSPTALQWRAPGRGGFVQRGPSCNSYAALWHGREGSSSPLPARSLQLPPSCDRDGSPKGRDRPSRARCAARQPGHRPNPRHELT